MDWIEKLTGFSPDGGGGGFELQILFIIKADRKAGRPISPSDFERTKIALHRIAMARRIL